VQNVESPAHIERLPHPARARRPRVKVEPGRLVPRSERLDGIVGHRRRRRDVGLSFHLIALLVNGAVMAPTEHREVRERGGSALGPVTEVMALAKRQPAARKPAAVIAVVQRAPDRRGNSSRSRADFHDLPIGVRAASPPYSRHTPGVGTSRRERVCRPRARTGPARPGPPAPQRRRGRRPGSARPARRGRSRGAAPSPRAGPARRPAAGPSRAFPRERPPSSQPRLYRALADIASRARRPAPA
jgi:hypothetical protein